MVNNIPFKGTLICAVFALALVAQSARAAAYRLPPTDGRWQYQLQGRAAFPATGGIDAGICATPFGGGACVRPAVFDIDLYAAQEVSGNNHTLNSAAVRAIHRDGGYAVCYVDAGSIETYRPDYRRFVRWDAAHGHTLIGKPFSVTFPDENYANVRNRQRSRDGHVYTGQRDFMLRMAELRTRKCARARFDAVEYDVVDSWQAPKRVTGWAIPGKAQVRFNRGLARIAHRHGMAAALKNDLDQVPQLIGSFDFAVDEECFEYGSDCRKLRAFVRAGKPVYEVEYTRALADFCPQANRWGFNSIRKSRTYDLYDRPYRPCR